VKVKVMGLHHSTKKELSTLWLKRRREFARGLAIAEAPCELL